MGSFDSIRWKCPRCRWLNEFQSKVGECNMQEYSIQEAPLLLIADMNASPDETCCTHCGARIELVVQFIAQVVVEGDENTPMREV